MRDQMIAERGKLQPPFLVRKCCIHNGSLELPHRMRGDMALETEIIAGRRDRSYLCIQCGHTIPLRDMMDMYQRYMVDGTPIVTGRKLIQQNAE